MTGVLQHKWEIDQLCNLVGDFGVSRVLEIGAWEGGTLRMWMDYADTIVVIDDMMRDSDNWRSWAVDTLVDLTLLQGDCAHPEIVKAAREHSPYDLVFLDADHTYEAGKLHWNIYRHMVAAAGMFAFHDIRPYEHGQLDRLWAEIKREPGARTAEFHHFEADWGGIGVVWM